MPFRAFDKLKTKLKILWLDFAFTQYEKRNSNNWVLFSCLIDLYFKFLILTFVFHFHKKMEN